MKYEFRSSTTGEVCCSASRVDYLCDSCRQKALGGQGETRVLRAGEPSLRALAGRRHSAEDQGHLNAALGALDSAADHLNAAGAGEGLEDLASHEESFEERHRILKEEDAPVVVRTLQDIVDARGYGCVPGPAPDPYAAARSASLDVQPTDDPLYEPKGQSADGYFLNLAARAEQSGEKVDIVRVDTTHEWF
jgi:hypothetical protein